jgi:hypothetical protein
MIWSCQRRPPEALVHSGVLKWVDNVKRSRGRLKEWNISKELANQGFVVVVAGLGYGAAQPGLWQWKPAHGDGVAQILVAVAVVASLMLRCGPRVRSGFRGFLDWRKLSSIIKKAVGAVLPHWSSFFMTIVCW